MSSFARSFTLAALVFAAAPAAFAQEQTADTVVATVNGVDITLGQLIVAKTMLPQQYQQVPDADLFGGLLDQLVQQELLAQTATDPSLRTRITIQNQTRALLAGSALGSAIDSAVTEDAVKAAYDEAVKSAEAGTEYRAAHILLATEDEAKAVVEELAAGADFAELAKAKSTGPSGPSGGDLGWFSKGMMVKPFEDAVTTMKDGDVSGPVQTQFGWHVIKLFESRIKAAPTLDEMRNDLSNQLQSAAVDKVIGDLEAAATVDRVDTSGWDVTVLSNTALLED